MLAAIGLITILVYYPGLFGDFLFDDHPHIVRNELTQIHSLEPAYLWQAWNSSSFDFPNSRPLAMLTFGVNHAFSGLNPFAFKATNLALHLLTGLVLYSVARRLAWLYLRLEGREAENNSIQWWAWLTTALWLVHPINLSPVLLSVQRMTILSTLFVLLGILFYLVGRQRLTDGSRYGLLWVWGSPIFAALGLLAKENALLLPVLLFVVEWTLFRFRGLNEQPCRSLKHFFVAVAALPLAAAAVYLIASQAYLGYATRPFSMEERLLSETRILWYYVRMLLFPDITLMGLFHDDIQVSRSLVEPWTTLVSVIALALAAVIALIARTRLPLLGFAILFFLVGHSMESTIFNLELVYEHRNYLPGIAVMFAVAYMPTVGAIASNLSRTLLMSLIGVVIIALGTNTAMRAHDWSGLGRLISAEVENHPDSLRANFQYAQLLMEQMADAEFSAEAAALAKHHFERVNGLNPHHADGLFGLLILELYQGRTPPQSLIDTLSERLRHLPWGPLNISTAQFAYLATWHDPARHLVHLTPRQMLQIFQAALDNPTLPTVGRGGLFHALGGYFQHTLGQTEMALSTARLAAQAVPGNWELLDRLVRLLTITGRFEEAESELAAAVAADRLGLYRDKADDLVEAIAAARRGESIPSWSPKKSRRFGFSETTP